MRISNKKVPVAILKRDSLPHITMLLLAGFILMLSFSIAHASNLQQAELLSSVNPALTSEPESAESYLKLANDLLDQQKFQKALGYYNKAISRDRDIDDAFLGRSLAYGSVGNAYESIADLNVYILRNPHHSMAHVYRGIRYMTQGNVEYAEENLHKAIKLDIKNAQSYDVLGVLYAQQGDMRKALQYFGKTLRLDPYNEMAYHNLAIAYYLLDDNEKALKAVARAIRLMPESRDTYILKAQILDALGQSEEAAKVREYAQYLNNGHWSESAALN